MFLIRFIATLLVIFILVGCNTIVDKKEVAFVQVPKNLTSKVRAEPPPSVKDYVEASKEIKEAMLVLAFRKQTINLGVCNEQLNSISTWSDKQFLLFNTQQK